MTSHFCTRCGFFIQEWQFQIYGRESKTIQSIPRIWHLWHLHIQIPTKPQQVLISGESGRALLILSILSILPLIIRWPPLIIATLWRGCFARKLSSTGQVQATFILQLPSAVDVVGHGSLICHGHHLAAGCSFQDFEAVPHKSTAQEVQELKYAKMKNCCSRGTLLPQHSTTEWCLVINDWEAETLLEHQDCCSGLWHAYFWSSLKVPIRCLQQTSILKL